jgi:hypothetical protein
MEPNQANTSGADHGSTDAPTSNQAEATATQTSGSAASNSTAGGSQTSGSTAGGGQGSNSNSADGKSWMEFANLQNLQKLTDQLPQGVRDFCTNSWSQVTTQVNKMSTTQKVAGAVALVGLGYLALRPGKSNSSRKQSRKNKRGSWDDTYRGSAYGSSTGSRYGNSSSGSYGSQQQSGAGSDFGSGYGSSYGSGASSTAGSSSASSAGSGEESTYRGSSLGGSSSAGRDV